MPRPTRSISSCWSSLRAPAAAGNFRHMADLSSLLQLGQQMQGRLSEMQSQLAQQTVTVSAGGGMVQATADGRGMIRSIKIDPQVVASGDIELLEDLVLAHHAPPGDADRLGPSGDRSSGDHGRHRSHRRDVDRLERWTRRTSVSPTIRGRSIPSTINRASYAIFNPAKTSASDDHTIALRLPHHAQRIFGLPYVSVSENGNLYRLFQLGNCIPGRVSVIKLCRGSRV